MCQLFFDRFRDFFYQMEKCREWDGTLWRWGRNYTHKTYITVSRCIHAMSSISEFSILAIIPILDTLSLKFTQWKGMHATSSMQIHPLILNSNASYPTTLSRWILRSSMPIHPRVLSISCVQGQLVGDISFSNKKVPLLHHWTTAVNLTTTTRTTMTMTTRTRMIGRLPGQVCSCWRSQFFSS